MIKYLTLLLLFCYGPLQAQKIKSLKSISWLEGSWMMEGKKGNNYERWKLVNENRMEGVGYKVYKKDTLNYELLELVMEGSDIFYIATVRGQNNDGPVRFKMTEGNVRHMVFENKEHDFPQVIDYRWKQNDRFNAEVTGLVKGKQKTLLFIFKKQ